MKSFRVGRIEGRWKNFLPPIQGGQYKDWDVEDKSFERRETTVSSASSDTSSRPVSPVFDISDQEGLRHRNITTMDDHSVSSLSELEDEPERPMKGKLSHLDTITQKAINLDLAKYPTLDEATQEHIQQEYRALKQRIFDAGLYDCNYTAYAIEGIRYVLFFGLFYYFLQISQFALSGLFLGILWHQLSFTVHDAGHMGITHDFTTDTVIGIVIADFIGGLSLGWWKRSHNVHHIVTNSAEHDPDIQHLPFFAVSHEFFASLRSSYHDHVMSFDNPASRWLVARQQYLYYPILCLGRFNLYAQSWIYLLSSQPPAKGPAWWTRWLELAGQAAFVAWFWYGTVYLAVPSGWSRFVFVMVSHVATMPLHVQITLSHFAMSTADLGVAESFPQRMLRTTMDVECPQWLDFVHGGLQFQAIHHLSPRIPRHNLREAQKLVMAFCRDVGIPYALYGFVDGSKEVIGRLGEVARQAAILAECQKRMAGEEDFGMHH